MVPLNLLPEDRCNKKNWSTICAFSNESLSDDQLDTILHHVLDRVVDDLLILDSGSLPPFF